MKNQEIAQIFGDIADILEIKEENRFRIRAYRKAQETIDREKAEQLEMKLRKAEFDLEDFLDQLRQIKKMGSLESILKMIPGMGRQLQNTQVDESGLVRTEAIISSMTKHERRNPRILNGSRRKRIAVGSGTRVQDVNQLMKQ